jgi:hypothetical protein
MADATPAADGIDADAAVVTGAAPEVVFAACETVTVCPATFTVPVRLLPLFAATVSVVEPDALPDAGFAAIHDTEGCTVQLHALAVEMVIFFEAEAVPGDQVSGDTVYEHPDT